MPSAIYDKVTWLSHDTYDLCLPPTILPPCIGISHELFPLRHKSRDFHNHHQTALRHTPSTLILLNTSRYPIWQVTWFSHDTFDLRLPPNTLPPGVGVSYLFRHTIFTSIIPFEAISYHSSLLSDSIPTSEALPRRSPFTFAAHHLRRTYTNVMSDFRSHQHLYFHQISPFRNYRHTRAWTIPHPIWLAYITWDLKWLMNEHPSTSMEFNLKYLYHLIVLFQTPTWT